MNQRAEGGFKTSGQEVEAGTFVLCRHSAFDRSGRRPELRRHQSSEGALLDLGHQWIVGSLCSGGILVVTADKKLMQGQPSSRLGWTVVAITTVAMFVAGIAMFVV